jgi:hypothetical protein
MALLLESVVLANNTEVSNVHSGKAVDVNTDETLKVIEEAVSSISQGKKSIPIDVLLGKKKSN